MRMILTLEQWCEVYAFPWHVAPTKPEEVIQNMETLMHYHQYLAGKARAMIRFDRRQHQRGA